MTVIDPVCGMKEDPERSAGSHVHQGQTYYFCGKGCLEKFRATPEKFLQPKLTQIGLAAPVSPAVNAATGAEWTCPMHPESVRNGPGSCPICGMALEPRTV